MSNVQLSNDLSAYLKAHPEVFDRAKEAADYLKANPQAISPQIILMIIAAVGALLPLLLGGGGGLSGIISMINTFLAGIGLPPLPIPAAK